MPNLFKTAVMRPLTAMLDVRSALDETPVGTFRWKENFSINGNNKLARARGFKRPFSFTDCPYRNWDYHTQIDETGREPITLLFSSTSTEGVRRLFMGTHSRLGFLNDVTGEWTVFSTIFGPESVTSQTQYRFHAAELNNYVLFTNDYDIPQIHNLGTTTIAAIAALAGAGEDAGGNPVAVTKARRIVEWRGFVFLLNTVEGGERWASRIRWCDLNKPGSWVPWTAEAIALDPANASLAGYQDLDYGEIILNAAPLGGSLWVFTDKSIWKCNQTIDVTNGTMQLDCVRVYNEPRNQFRCLAYPNSLVSDGFNFYYLGRDNIYMFNPYLTAPETPDWLNRASPIIYTDTDYKIDRSACEAAVAEVNYLSNETDKPEANEIHFSWPDFQPVDTGSDEVNCETNPAGTVQSTLGLNNHTLVANLKAKTCDYRDYGSTAMVNHRSDVLAQGNCNQTVLFLCGNGRDFCIKEVNSGYGRQYYDPDTGLYTTEGYFSVLRALFPFDKLDTEKFVRSFLAEVQPEDPSDASVLSLRIGTAHVALDPNRDNGNCGVIWHQLSKKAIACRSTRTPAGYAAVNLRPHSESEIDWKFLYRAKFVYFELKLSNSDGTASTTGGCSMSRFEVSARLS